MTKFVGRHAEDKTRCYKALDNYKDHADSGNGGRRGGRFCN